MITRIDYTPPVLTPTQQQRRVSPQQAEHYRAVRDTYKHIFGQGQAEHYEVSDSELRRYFPRTAAALSGISSDDQPQTLLVRVNGQMTAALAWWGEVARVDVFDGGGLVMSGRCTESGVFNWRPAWTK